MSICFMSHVDFKKRPCRPEFKGQGPPDKGGRLVGAGWGVRRGGGAKGGGGTYRGRSELIL